MSKVVIIDWRETSVYQKSMLRQETHPIQEAESRTAKRSQDLRDQKQPNGDIKESDRDERSQSCSH